MNEILQLILKYVPILLGIGLLLFYKKFIGEMAKQLAELNSIKIKTREIESVKAIFANELERSKAEIQKEIASQIESLKAELNRENIKYQIYNTEMIKIKFARIDELYCNLLKLSNFCQANLFMYFDDDDYELKKKKFIYLHRKAEDSLNRSAIYLSVTLTESASNILRESRKAISEFAKSFNTDPRIQNHMFGLNKENLIKQMIEQNNHSLENLEKSLDELQILLVKIREEFKTNLYPYE